MERICIHGVHLELRRIASPLGAMPRAPIVFLHEGLGSVSQWQQKEGYWPELVCAATGRAGLVYSRRGYGGSDPVPDVRGAGRLQAEYLHNEAWQVLPALLAALEIERPVLLGHSDGGSIALLYASRYPAEACIALAPHVMVEPISISAITAARETFLASQHDPQGLRAKLARYHADVDCAFWQWCDVWLSPAFASFDIRADCARITAPFLAVQGQQDPYGTMAQIDSIAQAIQTSISSQNPTVPASRGALLLQKIEQCGHTPQRDQCALTTRAVVDFLAHCP